MTQQRRQRINDVFAAASELDPQKRSVYLKVECGEDAELRAEVESLLIQFDADTPQILQGIKFYTSNPMLPPAPRIDSGKRVGKYEILAVIGHGGMGVVYKAQQENPRRIVALKVINPGVLNAVVLRRFKNETQALGQLQHPGIVQIFEADMYDAGDGAEPQPFFAMEYIEGLPIDEYANANKLDTRQRLELMKKVCDAVRHAHDQEVIHRDLKPGNILVTADGQPKILDFGIARIAEGGLGGNSDRAVGFR